MRYFLALLFLAALAIAVPLSSAYATIATTGDVEPTDPTTWNSSTTCAVGGTSAGTLTAGLGDSLLSYQAWIGASNGAPGVATLSGATWTNAQAMLVGGGANGTLNILSGGSVSSVDTHVAYSSSTVTGAVNVDGAGSYLTNSDGIYVGTSGAGTLNITNGASVSNPTGFVGYYTGSSGTATVSGAGSIWNNNNVLFVGSSTPASGYSCAGTLIINHGGTVSDSVNGAFMGYCSGSSATVIVDGAGSTWTNTWASPAQGVNIWLGVNGNATLKITNGGTVIDSGVPWANYSVQMANNSGSSATVTVDGAGSTWTNDMCLLVSVAGNGTINITNGGAVVNDVALTDYGGGGTVTVDGAGSTWTNRWIEVGFLGNGLLKITNGGTVVSNQLTMVGNYSGSHGNATIDGASSTWTNNSNLYIGYDGTGTVTQTGGYVSVAGTIFFAWDPGSSGTYNLNGGTLTAGNIVAYGGVANFNFGGGMLLATGSLSTSVPMNLTGIGGNANVNTAGYAVTLSGALSGVGGITKLGAGTLTLSGANGYAGTTTVQAGILELGTAAETPVLSGAGADVQGGQLVLDYISGSDIALTVRNLLQSHVITSSNLGGYHQLGWIDDTVNDKVTVVYTVGGDANLDYSVNGADLGAVLANFGKTGASWSDGDFNYDGTVNGADLGVVLANFGQHSSITAAVPEPNTLALLVAGAFGLLAYARRQRPSKPS